MTLHRGTSLFVFTLVLAAPGLAQAATAACMSPDGSCEVSNDGFDWTECMCADGSGVGGGGGNEWAGLTEMELQPICEEQLATFCGPFVPPDYVECGDLFGYCTIDNEPEDELECECWDGTGTSVVGGMMWAGWDDMQLYGECETQLATVCPPPASGLECSNSNGECTITGIPFDFVACECLGGSGGSGGGGNAWAGYDELQLHDECGAQLVEFCGGPLPPPLWQVCSSSLGECLIDNDPDRLECTCANGETIDVGGGNEWSGLSDEELFMECEEQLFEGCFVEEESSGSDTTAADSGDEGTSSGTGGSTGEPGDTGVDDSGSSSGGSGTPPPADSGDDTSGGASETGDGGAVGDGDGGGCSCSAESGSRRGGWALMLLALVGLGRRRRAARAG